jgi:hypothetical protein
MTGSPYTYFGVTSLAVYYAYAPTTGGNHQFTLTGATEYGAIAILAFSGAVSSPFDQHNGNALATNTTIQPGSITPTATNALVVSFAGSQNNNTTFSVTTLTLADQIAPSSTFNGVASAYELTNAGAINPTWTFDVAPNQDTAAIVSFLDGSGITPSVTLTLLGVGSP